MPVAGVQRPVEVSSDAERSEFYRMIGEGYKALHDGRVSTIDQVRERSEEKRKEHGRDLVH